jgi:hypothetical protein
MLLALLLFPPRWMGKMEVLDYSGKGEAYRFVGR